MTSTTSTMPSLSDDLSRLSLKAGRKKHTAVGTILSPFVLHADSVILRRKHSPTQYDADWLRTPVTARLFAGRRDALHKFQMLCELRHPNLENVLGVVLHDARSAAMIVTEHVPPHTVSHYMGGAGSRAVLSSFEVVTVALHVARTLVYLQMAAANGLSAGVCEHTIAYDRTRSRGIVLLTAKCTHRCQYKSDVEMLADVVSKLCHASKGRAPTALRALLARCSSAHASHRPRIVEVAQQLALHHQSLS